MTLRELNTATLDFSGSADWVNRTERFFLPILPLRDGGLPLTYPIDERWGENSGKPLRKDPNARGIVIWNEADQTLQGIKGDGTEGLMFNDISGELADEIYLSLFDQNSLVYLYGDDPERTRRVIEHIIALHGLTDVFQKDTAEVLAEHELIFLPMELEEWARTKGPIGHFRCTKPQRHQAVWCNFPFAMTSGPVPQNYPTGAVVVTNGRHRWGVASQVFERNFWRVDGENETPIRDLETARGIPLLTSFPE